MEYARAATKLDLPMPGSPMRAGVAPTSRACLMRVVRVSVNFMSMSFCAWARKREGEEMSEDGAALLLASSRLNRT